MIIITTLNYRKNQYDEYKVLTTEIDDNGKKSKYDYFTDDLDDAKSTLEAIHKRYVERLEVLKVTLTKEKRKMTSFIITL